ncbi:hypothetical protein MASR1M36_08720 [Candidatus Cloacimonadaceae bacterium]
MDKPKRRRMTCPVCSGTGIIKENSEEYSFVTRDPLTSKCLICNGEGFVGPRKKLPDGTEVHQIASGMPASARTGGCQTAVPPTDNVRTGGRKTAAPTPLEAIHSLDACLTGIVESAGLTVLIIRGVINHQELSSIISSALQPSNQIKE